MGVCSEQFEGCVGCSGEAALVRLRPLLAWSIYGGLTVPVGILAHLCYEGSGGVIGRFGSLEPDHALLFAIAAAWLGWSVRTLRHGSSGDRRARLSGLKAALPRPAVLVTATAVTQAAVAALSLACEGVRVAPAHVAVAAVVGTAIALLGAIGFFAVRDEVLGAAAGVDAPGFDTADGLDVAARRDAIVVARSAPSRLHRGRAPPLTS
jgi:hypothetical protein